MKELKIKYLKTTKTFGCVSVYKNGVLYKISQDFAKFTGRYL